VKKIIFRKYLLLTVLLSAFSALSSIRAGAQQLGVKTNALMWALMAPNAGMEIVVGERSSIDISAFCKPRFSAEKGVLLNSRIIGFQPEYRYWFNGRPMTREFVGVSAMLADYYLHHKEYVYDGNALSLGLVGGYSFVLGSNWRLELCGGFAFLGFLQKRYHINDNYDDYFVGEYVKANSWGYKLFPAKLGVTFTYVIK
jgi:hypothetical protein